MRRTWIWRAIAVGAAAAVALGACTGDDEPDDVAAFCDALVDADAGTAELAAAVEAAPEEIRADVTAMADEGDRAEVATGMTGGPSSGAFFAAASSVGDYMADHCGYQVIDVTATDHALDGIPADVEAGRTLIRITNEGTEYHEIALQRVQEGETRPVDEILALPEGEGGGDLFDYLGNAFAPPGLSSWTVVDLSAGRHVALCYVPTGATPEAVQSGPIDDPGTSHAIEGELAEMEVS